MKRTQSSTEDQKLYKKRSGSNARKGFLYEIRICMLLILRCVAQGLGFELKCNVEDEEKLFDDVVCKITKPCESGPDQVKHLFLQAKHFTGKNASIFKQKNEKRQKSQFPKAVVNSWFKSFQTLCKAYTNEYFEMVFYTTTDIEEELKPYFINCTTAFSDLILCDTSKYENIYGINPEYFTKQDTETEGVSDQEIEQFCHSVKIVILQPEQEEVGKQIRTELQANSEYERQVIYNEACAFMETWHNENEQATVIDWDIFAQAARKTDHRLLKKLLPLHKSSLEEFSFNEKTIVNLKTVLDRGENVTAFSVDSFSVFTDIIKQYLRECEKDRINLFCFSLKDLLQNLEMATENFQTLKNPTYILVKISDQDINEDHLNFENEVEKLKKALCGIFHIHVIFVLNLSSGKHIPNFIPGSQQETFGKFQQLSQMSQERVLNHSIEFMGEGSTLGELNAVQLIDGKLLGMIREEEHIEIGEALPKVNYNPCTYISRQLKLLNKVRKDKNCTDSKDLFIVLQEGTIDPLDSSQKTSACSENKMNNVIIVCSMTEAHTQFQEACKQNKGVHLLELKQSELFWIQTGNCDFVAENFDSLIDVECPSTCSEEELIERHFSCPLSCKVVLVSSSPGMGKSQLAYSLACSLRDQRFWTILLNLNQCTELLESLQNTDVDSMDYMFLLGKIVSQTKFHYFKLFLQDSLKVVMILDGFDEIAPKYTNIVLAIVKSMCKIQIVIFTRPHLAKRIQKETSGLLVHLSEFTKADIERYLEKHYQFYITVQQEGGERLNKFILELTELIFSKGRAYWMEVTGVPLQTYMVAEVFRERCEKYITNNSPVSDMLPSETDRYIDFYETILKQKVKLTLEQKYGATSTHLVEELIKPLQKTVCADHISCGLVLIFEETFAREYFNTDIDHIVNSPYEIYRYGIVTALSKEHIEFIHRSFAEYFCAMRITDVLVTSSGASKLKKFIFNSVLVVDQYELIRKFIDIMFSKEEKDICMRVENSRFVTLPELLMDGGAQTEAAYDSGGESVTESEPGEESALLVESGNDPGEESSLPEDCSRVLYVAAREGNVHITRKLLRLRHQEQGAQLVHKLIGYKDERQQSALHVAAKKGSAQNVAQLLEAGACHSMGDERRQTPLHHAAMTGHPECVRELLQAGASHSGTDWWHRQTALHSAAGLGCVESVRLLLEAGASHGVTDKERRTPLHRAAYKGHLEVVRRLLTAGASHGVRDGLGLTPLHLAAETGQAEAARQLLAAGADSNITDEYRSSPLHLAATEGHAATVRALLDGGADPGLCDWEQSTALHEAAHGGHLAVVELLLDKPTHREARDKDGRTALHKAALCGHTSIVRLLASRGCQVDVRDRWGSTPLHDASRQDHEETVRALIEHGAGVDGNNSLNQAGSST